MMTRLAQGARRMASLYGQLRPPAAIVIAFLLGLGFATYPIGLIVLLTGLAYGLGQPRKP